MSREAIDALEEWHATTLALRRATPGTSEWARLRMISEDQRVAYEALLEEPESVTEDSGTSRREAERQTK